MGPTDAKGGPGGALQNYSQEAGGVDRERSLWGGADDVAGYNYFRKSRSLTRITVIRLYQTNACLGRNAMT